MSMLPLTAATFGLSLFSMNIPVQDFVFTTSKGRDTKQPYGTRTTVRAAVDPSGAERLEEIFGGNVSDGDIAIYTREVLHISDIYPPGGDRRQTYITYGGLKYSVAEKADWKEQANVYIYRASRYVEQDL